MRVLRPLLYNKSSPYMSLRSRQSLIYLADYTRCFRRITFRSAFRKMG